MIGSAVYLAAVRPPLVWSLAELAAFVVVPYLCGVAYWVALTKERRPRWREFAWAVSSWDNALFVACLYAVLIGVATGAPALLAATAAHPAAAGVVVAAATTVLVPLGRVLWTKVGSSVNGVVRLRIAGGDHAADGCLDLVVDNRTTHDVYNVSVREIAGSPGHLAQLPPPLVALLTGRGIGIVPTDGLRFCLGPVAQYGSPAQPIMVPAQPIMVVASWLDRSPRTGAGAEREQKPDDCVSVIDLYAVALQGLAGVARGQAAAVPAPPVPPAAPVATIAPTSATSPTSPTSPSGGGNGAQPPTP